MEKNNNRPQNLQYILFTTFSKYHKNDNLTILKELHLMEKIGMKTAMSTLHERFLKACDFRSIW